MNEITSVPFAGTYEVVFNSDDTRFGGDGKFDKTIYKSEKIPMHSQQNSVELSLPGLSAMFIRCKRKNPQRKDTGNTTKIKKEDNKNVKKT